MKIRVTSTQNLISFLKKLKVVDKGVLLELNPEKLFCKVHTPDKSVMKFSSIPINQIFDGLPGWEDLGVERIKIGLIDVTKFMDCFKYFRPEEEIFIHLEVGEVDGETVATEMKIISKSLKIRVRCADLSLLNYVEDAILQMVHSKEDPLGSFKVYQSDFSSVASLCGLESNSEELLVFKVGKEKVNVTGDSFDFQLNIGPSEINCEKDFDSSIYKSHLNYVDAESSSCYVHESRIVFFSEQTQTSTAIGVIEK